MAATGVATCRTLSDESLHQQQTTLPCELTVITGPRAALAAGWRASRRQALARAVILTGAGMLPASAAVRNPGTVRLLELRAELDQLGRRISRLHRQVLVLPAEAEPVLGIRTALSDLNSHQQLRCERIRRRRRRHGRSPGRNE